MGSTRSVLSAALTSLSVCFLAMSCVGNGEVIQPDSPMSNAAVVNARVLGTPGLSSWVRRVIDDGQGGVYLAARLNNEEIVGRYDLSGVAIWTSVLGQYRAEDISHIPSSAGSVGGGVAVVTSDQITVFRADGLKSDEITVSNDSADVWLSGIRVSDVPAGVAELVVVGGADVDGVSYPFAVRASVDVSGRISVVEQKIESAMPDMAYDDMAIDGQPASAFYVIAYAVQEPTLSPDKLLRLDDSLAVDWSIDIADSTVSNSIVWEPTPSGSDVFLVGREQGETWASAIVGSVSSAGQPNWLRRINRSQFGDAFYGCYVDQGTLYAVGETSGFYRYATRREYGYAWLAEIDSQTGDVLSERTFGEAAYSSGFNDLVVVGRRAYAFGWTQWYVGPYGSRGWLLEVDLDAPAQADVLPLAPGDLVAPHGRGPVTSPRGKRLFGS